jgi:hypothetical protein
MKFFIANIFFGFSIPGLYSLWASNISSIWRGLLCTARYRQRITSQYVASDRRVRRWMMGHVPPQ